MKYVAAIVGFVFCLASVMAIVLVLGAAAMIFFDVGAIRKYNSESGGLPIWFWISDLLTGTVLGLATGYHSFRATLRRANLKREH